MSLRDWKNQPEENHFSPVATAKAANPAKAEPANPSTFATFATFAIASTPDAAPESAPDDLSDGWRRQLATDTWHTDWSAVWKRGSATVTANQLPFVIADLVNAWNVCTGDRRTVAEYLKHLSPIDHADQEIMCRGWLALYAWTLFHRETQS